MFARICRATARRTFAICAGLAGLGLTMAALVPTVAAAASTHEITVTVTKFKALDKADDLSRGDFFARVTINDKAKTSGEISDDKAEVKPDWKLSTSVPPGVHKVRLELIDKDLTVDDPIDINRVAGKRDLEFTVDTNSCVIEGFSQTYKCGATITRSGSEHKKADISFKVTVKK